MTPNEYALARGWDYGCIEDTARKGVCEADIAALQATNLTPEALHLWCAARVLEAASVEATEAEREATGEAP